MINNEAIKMAMYAALYGNDNDLYKESKAYRHKEKLLQQNKDLKRYLSQLQKENISLRKELEDKNRRITSLKYAITNYKEINANLESLLDQLQVENDSIEDNPVYITLNREIHALKKQIDKIKKGETIYGKTNEKSNNV